MTYKNQSQKKKYDLEGNWEETKELSTEVQSDRRG